MSIIDLVRSHTDILAIRKIAYTLDCTTQVVTRIDIVTDIRKARYIDTVLFAITEIGLCVTQDISSTRTSKRVEDAAVTQSDDGITSNRTFEASAIDELTFRQIIVVSL